MIKVAIRGSKKCQFWQVFETPCKTKIILQYSPNMGINHRSQFSPYFLFIWPQQGPHSTVKSDKFFSWYASSWFLTLWGIFEIENNFNNFEGNWKYAFFQKTTKTTTMFYSYLNNQMSLRDAFVFKTNGTITYTTSYRCSLWSFFTSRGIKPLNCCILKMRKISLISFAFVFLFQGQPNFILLKKGPPLLH